MKKCTGTFFFTMFRADFQKKKKKNVNPRGVIITLTFSQSKRRFFFLATESTNNLGITSFFYVEYVSDTHTVA